MSLQQRAYRQAVVLQQVSQDLHQRREVGPLFGFTLPAAQHDAISASRGQHRHIMDNTDVFNFPDFVKKYLYI